MIRVEFDQRLIKTLRKLGPEIHAATEKRIAQITEDFGNPHAHGGLGLRKLSQRVYEARVGLHWRLALVQHQDRLLAVDLMTHEEIRRWLRSK
jgi:mRNA-degrading endonuclease RelE of RelBE toxin-antitoxin system